MKWLYSWVCAIAFAVFYGPLLIIRGIRAGIQEGRRRAENNEKFTWGDTKSVGKELGSKIAADLINEVQPRKKDDNEAP